MTSTTEIKTLANYGNLELVQHLTSGDCYIIDTATGATSPGLSEDDVAYVLADPGSMSLADLAPSTLVSDALALVPARHWKGDVALVTAREFVRTAKEMLTAERLAQLVTAELDEAAADWAAEQKHLASLAE